jgi:hypothetical protein
LEVLAVAIDPTEPVSELQSVAARESYPFPVATVNPEMVAAYQVLIRSTKIAVDSNGFVVDRWGYSAEPLGGWRVLFESLVQG